MISLEEKKKVICITLGINETKVLKLLSKFHPLGFEGWISYEFVFGSFQDNPSIRHHSTLGNVLFGLKRKKFIEINNETNAMRITKKGILILEVIKKEDN